MFKKKKILDKYIMPRVLKIDSMTNRPICKSAGSGGGVGSSLAHLCHIRARTGVGSQCFTCKIWGQPDKIIGCNPNGIPCGMTWSAGSYGR